MYGCGCPCKLTVTPRRLGRLRMKWVTREHIHLDRVACPWLVRRFIDKQAEFVFVPFGKEDSRPKDAIPYAIPGVELGPHDDKGTTFQKMVAKYKLNDPALDLMGEIIHHSIAKGPEKTRETAHLGIGLYAISNGLAMLASGDIDNLDRSMAVYDAVYAFCKDMVVCETDQAMAKVTGLAHYAAMRPVIKKALG